MAYLSGLNPVKGLIAPWGFDSLSFRQFNCKLKMLPRNLHNLDPKRKLAYGYVCDIKQAKELASWFKKASDADLLLKDIVILKATDTIGFEKSIPYIISTGIDYIIEINDPHYHEHTWIDIPFEKFINE